MGDFENKAPQDVYFSNQNIGELFKGKGSGDFFELRSQEENPVYIKPGDVRRVKIGARLEPRPGYHIVIYPSDALEKSDLTLEAENVTGQGLGTSLLVRNTLVKQEGIGAQGFQPIKLGTQNPNGPGIAGVYEIDNGDLLGHGVYEKRNVHYPAN